MNPQHTPDIRRRAHEVAISVADNIWDAIRAGGPLLPEQHALSLSDGYPAVALLFAELAAHDLVWQPRLHAVLAEGTARLRSAPMNGLFAGPMSVGFALHMAGIATGGYTSARARLDAAISRRVTDLLAKGVVRQRLASRQLTMADYDLVSGLGGSLRYFLLDPARNADTIALILTELIELIHTGQPNRPGWTVAGPPVVGTDRAEFPLGHANVGMAHGAAGILAALSFAVHKGLLVRGQEQAIALLSEWLLANRLNDEHGVNWPAYIAIDRKAVTPTTQPKGWCYGIAGIARALQLAGTAIGDVALISAADAAAQSMLARPVRPGAAVESGLCHGWSGTLHAVWRWTTSSKARVPDGWDAIICRKILARYDPDSRLGYRTRMSAGTEPILWADDAGFIRGAAGISLSLLRFARDAPPATLWDAALLLG